MKFLDIFLVVLGKLRCELFGIKFAFKSRAYVERYQFKKLKKLLTISYHEIPFYKEKFDKAGFNPVTDFLKLSDMKKVPVLEKEEARKCQKQLLNSNRLRFALNFKTSGSTGNPFSAFISPTHWLIEQSCIWRHWSWAGYRFRDRMAIVRSHVPANEDDLIRWDRLRNFIYFSPFHLTDKHIAFYLKEMCRMKVRFIRGYPSSILAIAEYINQQSAVEVPNVKGVLTASEYLSPSSRIKIEKAFGVKVFNHYGLAEQVVMFGGCEKAKFLHNYEEYGHLELLETEDEKLKLIVGTNLHNFAMPLIRYNTGDLAEVNGGECNCGRTSTVIKNVIGRESATIVLQDDSKVPVTNFYTMFEHYDSSITQWQMVQSKSGSLNVILHLKKNVMWSDIESSIRRDIESRVDRKLDLVFDFEGQFHKVGEGKVNPFVRF